MNDAHETHRVGDDIVVEILADTDYSHAYEEMKDDDIVITYMKRSRDVLGTKAIDTDERDELERRVEAGEIIALPVYAYVHSGATIRCAPFSCPWDSGQSGIVYCTREWANKELAAKTDAEIYEILSGYVKTYDDLLTGNVWGFRVSREVDPDNSDARVELDSCWGFVGDIKYCREEALAAAAHHAA